MICDYPEIEILTDFLTTGDISNLYIIDEEKYIFLNRISYFISNLDLKDIEGFINIIELVYLDHKTNQNCIINNVLSIESLILSDTNNIEKSFVLKSGIILKYSDFSISNDEIKYILNFIYNIRSDIVHGNYFKIEADFDRLKSKVPNCKDILDGSNIIYSKEKDLPYAIANVYSNILLFSIIKYWIFNQDKLDFIKHN